jgi:hypothetical protein
MLLLYFVLYNLFVTITTTFRLYEYIVVTGVLYSYYLYKIRQYWYTKQV